MNKIYTDAEGLLPARQVCARYKIVGRTLDRWLADERLQFPRPLIINKRRYFKERLLQSWERARAAVKR
jgi:phage antirepressor YoqD-like protein